MLINNALLRLKIMPTHTNATVFCKMQSTILYRLLLGNSHLYRYNSSATICSCEIYSTYMKAFLYAALCNSEIEFLITLHAGLFRFLFLRNQRFQICGCRFLKACHLQPLQQVLCTKYFFRERERYNLNYKLI